MVNCASATVFEVLRTASLLSGESDEALATLIDMGQLKRYRRYGMLGREGGPAEASIILQGSVLRTCSRDDATVPPERLGPGDCVGFELVVEPRLPLGATYQAAEPTTTLAIPLGFPLPSAREAARCRLVYELIRGLSFFCTQPTPSLDKLSLLFDLHYCTEATDLGRAFGYNLGSYLIVVASGAVHVQLGVTAQTVTASHLAPWLNEPMLLDAQRQPIRAQAAPGTKLLLLPPATFSAFLAIAPKFRHACRHSAARAFAEQQAAHGSSELSYSSQILKARRMAVPVDSRPSLATQSYSQSRKAPRRPMEKPSKAYGEAVSTGYGTSYVSRYGPR